MRRLLGKAVTRSGVLVLLALAGAAGVLAYFTITGIGTASARVTVLAAPTISPATPGAGTVALSWSPVSAPGSGAVTYYVSRDGGAPEGDCPSSTSTSTVTSCTDAGVSVATHSYTVTAVWRSWTAASTTVSAQVTFGPATYFLLTAATTTPTAGVADNLTIIAKDESNNTVATYTGSHNLTFGGASSIGALNPTVTSSVGVVTNFGTVTAISFVNGVATVAGTNNGVMKLDKAETALVTVTDGTINNGIGLSVTVAAAAAASFSLVAVSTVVTAGEADNLTVTALDAFGNTAVSYAGSHNLTFGGAGSSVGGNKPTVTSSAGVATSFGTAEAITFASGVATVAGTNNGVMKLYKAEVANVTVAAGAVNNGAGLAVTVNFAPAASLGLAAASITPTAGVADNVTITAKDTYGNTITTYTGSHGLTFGGANAIGSFTPTVTDSSGTVMNLGTAEAITFTNGVATVTGSNNGAMTLYKAEAAKVTVTDGTLNNGAGLTVTVAAATATSLSLTAASITPTAGVADNLTVTAKDTYGNTATGYTGSHNLTFGGASSTGAFNPTVTSSAGVVTNFGSVTAISFVNGVATVAGTNNGVMKLYKAETALIMVTDGTINNGAGLSVTVAAAAAASFSLTAVSTTVTAGEADNLMVTALDAFGNTAITYTGSHNLTFGGASNSANGNKPTVTNSAGVATNFGTAEAITFASGIATIAGANNGVMKLYKAEVANVTVVAGAVNNGAGLAVTVNVGPPARLAWTNVTVSAGTLSVPCLFICTVTTLGNAGTLTANVSVTDSSGNTVSGLGAGYTVTVSTPSSGAGSGGSFTAPTAGTSVTLTIASAGTADSTVQFTFKAQSGVWVSDTMTAQTLTGTSYTNATATLNK
jgi:hypothetical protein